MMTLAWEGENGFFKSDSFFRLIKKKPRTKTLLLNKKKKEEKDKTMIFMRRNFFSTKNKDWAQIASKDLLWSIVFLCVATNKQQNTAAEIVRSLEKQLYKEA